MNKYLVQILLPVSDNEGTPFPDDVLQGLQAELAERFGGVTAYNRAPAKGVWRHNGQHQTDDIVVVEVMTEVLNRNWWRAFRQRLEILLRQQVVVMRAHEFQEI